MNLDFSIIIGFFGIVLTIYSIYISVKRKKYPGKLTLIKENTVGLFNELANTFEEIKIEFKDSPIDKNIIYIKGSIINNGENDLNLNNSEVPVGLNLKDNLKWIKSKITKSSDNVRCNTEIQTDGVLNFKCGYLKINEFFQFEALIETSNSKFDSGNIFEQIEPKHRLMNTQKISIISYLDVKERQGKLTFFKGMLILIVLMIPLFIGSAAYKTYFPSKTIFEYVSDGKKFKATPLTDNKIEIDGIDNNLNKKVSITEFNEKYKPTIPNKNFWDYLIDKIWVFVIVIAMMFLLSIFEYILSKESRQLSIMIEKKNRHNN